MLVLAFHRLDRGGIATFHNIPLLSLALKDTDAQLLSVQSLPTALEGQVSCHTNLWLSLISPEGPLHRPHVAAVVSPKMSGPADYRYRLIEAISPSRDTVRLLLGNSLPPRSRARDRPMARPTRWYCHKCNCGPYNIATQSGCTNVIDGHQCDHQRCGYCRKE